MCCGPKEGPPAERPAKPAAPTGKRECRVNTVVDLRDTDTDCAEEDVVPDTNLTEPALVTTGTECQVSDIVSLKAGCGEENPCQDADESTILRCNLLPPVGVDTERDPGPKCSLIAGTTPLATSSPCSILTRACMSPSLQSGPACVQS